MMELKLFLYQQWVYFYIIHFNSWHIYDYTLLNSIYILFKAKHTKSKQNYMIMYSSSFLEWTSLQMYYITRTAIIVPGHNEVI